MVARRMTKRNKMSKGRKRRYRRAIGRGYRSLPLADAPKSKVVRMRYVETVTIDHDGLDVPDMYVWSANGVYDPNITGGGHQPYGFDQCMQDYNHYQVIGSKITVRSLDTAGGYASTTPGIFTVNLQDSAANKFTNVSHMLETIGRSYSTYGLLGSASRIPQGIGNAIVRKFSSKKFFKKGMNQDDIQGNISSNPTEQAYYVLYTSNFNGNNPGAVTFVVMLEYIVLLTERKALAQS